MLPIPRCLSRLNRTQQNTSMKNESQVSDREDTKMQDDEDHNPMPSQSTKAIQTEIPNSDGYSIWSWKDYYNAENKKLDQSKNEVKRLNTLLSKRDTRLTEYEQNIQQSTKEMKQLQQQ
eukprot:379069_1